MMKKIYITLLIIACASVNAVAQVMYYNYNTAKSAEKIRFENVEVTQKSDTVNVAFDLMVEPKAVKNGQGLFIVPGVKAPKGEISLPVILVNGKTRSGYYKREQALQGKHPILDLKPTITMTSDNKDGQAAHYSHSFIMTPDLDGAEVVIDQYIEDCCEVTPVGGSNRLITQALRYRPVVVPEVKVEEPKPVQVVAERPRTLDLRHSVTFIEPEQEVVKEREEAFQAYIGYPVNQFDVRPYFENNMAELTRIDGVVAPLMRDREGIYDIKGMRIEGYASPEGTWGHNENLARNRANGFWMYMRGRYPVLQGVRNVSIMSFGEDWDGLVRMINDEFMPYNKYDILNIIERYGIFEGREAKLMLYAGGGPYRYMLHNFFPKLRRMEITIDYDVKKLNEKEAASVYKSRPGDLSQFEMIRLARAQGTDILATYDVAVLYFPDDPIALINGSSAELIRGNADKAWTYLSKIANDPRAYNNIGVYYMLKGNTENAKYYFRLAIPHDNVKANYNLRLIEREFPVSPTVAPVVSGGAVSAPVVQQYQNAPLQHQQAAPAQHHQQATPVQQQQYHAAPAQQQQAAPVYYQQPAAQQQSAPVYYQQSAPLPQHAAPVQQQQQSAPIPQQPTAYHQQPAPAQQQQVSTLQQHQASTVYYQQPVQQQEQQPVYQQQPQQQYQQQPQQQQQQQPVAQKPVTTEFYRYK